MLREMRKQYGWMPDGKLMDERFKEDAAYNEIQQQINVLEKKQSSHRIRRAFLSNLLLQNEKKECRNA